MTPRIRRLRSGTLALVRLRPELVTIARRIRALAFRALVALGRWLLAVRKQPAPAPEARPRLLLLDGEALTGSRLQQLYVQQGRSVDQDEATLNDVRRHWQRHPRLWQ